MTLGEILEKYLELWLEAKGHIIKERGIDGYVAVVNFIEFIRENDIEEEDP